MICVEKITLSLAQKTDRSWKGSNGKARQEVAAGVPKTALGSDVGRWRGR